MNAAKMKNVLNRLHLTVPAPRDHKPRLPCIPEAAQARVKYDPKDPNRRVLARDVEAANGGAGVFNVDLKRKFCCYDNLPSPCSRTMLTHDVRTLSIGQ